MANPTQADVDRAVAVARNLESRGYFTRVRQGDQRAASYFVRMVAYEVNPNGISSDFGCLSKTPGETNVDGFAEDAICFGNLDADRQNAVDMVNGTGAPGASIGGAIKERRENNRWIKPQPLTSDQVAYLLNGAQPIPPPSQVVFPPRNETMAAFNAINEKYHQKGRANRIVLSDTDPYPLYIDNEGIAVWLQQYLLYRVNGKSHQVAVDQVLADIEAAWQ